MIAPGPNRAQTSGDAPHPRELIEKTILGFCDAFNREALDDVMAYFTDDALYATIDGARRQGKAAIRRELEPQFQGLYGAMRFDNEDLIVDADQNRAVLRWMCEHRPAWRPRSLRGRLLQPILRLIFGRRAAWQGLDVFYLSEGRIREKHTFARTRLPRVSRTLEPERWRGR